MQISHVLEIKDLCISYHGNSHASNEVCTDKSHLAVDDISIGVREGDLLGIVGPNGAGKTTLFRAILGLHPYAGSISLFGFEQGSASGNYNYHALLPLVGYVPQKIAFEINFPATVRDVVAMGMLSAKRLAKGAALVRQCGFDWKRIYEGIDGVRGKVTEALKTVGLEHLGDRRIGQLSAGEMQRVFIAKSLVKDPLLLILDEPVTSVDVESQTKFYNVIKKINRENNIAIVWSSHDLDAISKYANKVACMNKRLFFHGHKDEFFSDPALLKTYTESSMQVHMHHHRHTDDGMANRVTG